MGRVLRSSKGGAESAYLSYWYFYHYFVQFPLRFRWFYLTTYFLACWIVAGVPPICGYDFEL